MHRFLRTASAVAITVAAMSAIADAASAQTYNRLVVFGDSLSDNGNLFASTGGAAPASPPYFQGRFSSGVVFTELLGFNAGRYAAGAPVTGSINYAFGGSRTDTIATPGPGMRTQLAAYQGAGGVFGPNDLVTVLGGANNIFQALPTAGASSNPTGSIAPVSTGAAADINFIVNTVAGGGAGTILVVNLPKLSLTPQFRTSVAAPLADFAVTTFNGALYNGLLATSAAQPNSNIILMDLFKIGDTISGNPLAFGISNVTDACFNGVTVCSNPNDYFYFDGVHPTAAGHRVLAALANDYLYYGDTGAQIAILSETTYRLREDMMDSASEALSARHGWGAGSSLSFGAVFDRTQTDDRGVVTEADIDSDGIRIALEHSDSENWRFVLAGSARRANGEGGGQTFELESFGMDAGLGWRSGSLFANATGGVSLDNVHNYKRATGVGPVVHSGSTDGASRSVRVQAGYWMDTEGVAISPRVALGWTSASLDGFTEQGVAAQYAYADRTVEALTAEFTVRAEGEFGDGVFYIEGGYRDALDDSSEAVGTGLAGGISHVLEREIEDPFGGQVIASAGIERDLGPVRMTVGYRGRFGEYSDSHVGGVNFVLKLQ